jgi:hypothetical protein
MSKPQCWKPPRKSASATPDACRTAHDRVSVLGAACTLRSRREWRPRGKSELLRARDRPGGGLDRTAEGKVIAVMSRAPKSDVLAEAGK